MSEVAAPQVLEPLPPLPDDWGTGAQRQTIFALPDEWPALLDRYDAFRVSEPLKRTWAIVKQLKATHVLLEGEYVDADYADEYAHFYAQTFPQIPDRCERLHFVRGHIYLGYTSLRPIRPRPVSRTMLALPPSVKAHVACSVRVAATPYQEALDVQTFPFLGQDARYGVCAHASIWMVTHYHHVLHQTPRVFMSDIVAAAARRPEIGRQKPSTGLTAAQMATAFRTFGLPVVTYDVASLKIKSAVSAVACRYLNSRIPVVLVTRDHSTVLIGYGKRNVADVEPFFISHDDAAGPFVQTDECHDDTSVRKWEMLMVPLPGRIYLLDEEAEAFAVTVLRDAFRLAAKSGYGDPPPRAEIRYRTYCVRARDYRQRLADRGVAPEALAIAARASTSDWVWVTEMQDRVAASNGCDCVIAEVVVDATSDPEDPNPLFAIIPSQTLVWRVRGGEPTTFAHTQSAANLLRSGTALHVP